MSKTTIDGFESAPSRLVGEREERLALAARALQYHHGFLDDCIRAILPHDLILLGAPSGMGKTDLALSIAVSNAMKGMRVHYFALEAEPRELERRTKFALLSRRAWEVKRDIAGDMNYADWMLGNCEHVCADMNSAADHRVLSELGGLRTYYRGARFDHEDLRNAIMAIHEQTDLIIIDHLHYIDSDSDDNEARGLGDTVKAIRDVSLRIGRPILLVAHLRKRDTRGKQIVASLDDFHGSSNIVKICTQAIAIEAARSIVGAKWHLAPTFMTVLKDRRAGATGLVAVTNFDRRTKGYCDEYTLGRIVKGGTEWEEIERADVPKWARLHRSMTS